MGRQHTALMIRYVIPDSWIKYDLARVSGPLVNAKAAVLALGSVPYQRSWAEKLQAVQLKREVEGTSRIEGAEFSEPELDIALRETPEQLATRSQKQAAAAVGAYRWIARLPEDRPLDDKLILEIHRRIVTGADDDHCEPGKLRGADENVTFGLPRHRGANGGDECAGAFAQLCAAAREMRGHDPLIQALAVHYHLAAMHPFMDGNGRTARALEAFLLQKQGLRDTLFIAMSNYYYEEKNDYLGALAQVRRERHDLGAFLVFGLKGIEKQCMRLLDEIKKNIAKSLFRDTMHDLFGRLQNKRKRVIAERQLKILEVLLESDMGVDEARAKHAHLYRNLRNPASAFERDLAGLLVLGALRYDKKRDIISARMEWPVEITETEFFKRIERLPKARTRIF